jgi:hypothetical protein
MKICLKCNRDLQLKKFYTKAGRYDGHENYCKECYGSQFDYTLKFTPDIIQIICKKFVNLKFMCAIPLVRKYTLNELFSDKLIYICVGVNGEILKVGQTTNWKNRTSTYSGTLYSPITMYFFEADSWKAQDELEMQVRLLLEDMGYVLLWDNTGSRLNHIKV